MKKDPFSKVVKTQREVVGASVGLEQKEDKLHMALVSIAGIAEKTLLPPDHMKNPSEAKAYMLGSAAAFKQMAEMAKFVLEEVRE